MSAPPPLRRIAVVPTGGTIQMTGIGRLDLAHYASEIRPVDPAQLLARVPEIEDLARVEIVDFGWHKGLAPNDWIQLGKLVYRLLEKDGYDGAVVTHGTNTLEETAYFLGLTVRTEKPLIVAGAMRPPSGMSADGDLNLIRAVLTASSPAAAGLGALVVLNDTIHGARDATKRNTLRVQAFESPDTGPLGYADSDGRIVITKTPTTRHTARSAFAVEAIEDLPRVDIVSSYAGQDGVAIEAALAAGAAGLVLAGAGAAGRTDAEDAALRLALERGVAVVLASRTGSGRVAVSTSEAERGFIAAGDLNPWKARVLLMLALTRSRSTEEIQGWFDTH